MYFIYMYTLLYHLAVSTHCLNYHPSVNTKFTTVKMYCSKCFYMCYCYRYELLQKGLLNEEDSRIVPDIYIK